MGKVIKFKYFSFRIYRFFSFDFAVRKHLTETAQAPRCFVLIKNESSAALKSLIKSAEISVRFQMMFTVSFYL